MVPGYYCFLWDLIGSHHTAALSKCVCLSSLIRNQELQRTEVDTGKKPIFTNNIPKAGFLINPQDPIPRQRRGVSLSHRLWEMSVEEVGDSSTARLTGCIYFLVTCP